MPIGKHLAKNLRYLRKEKKLKQDEMGTTMGISGPTWSNYENGITEPDIDALIKISIFFKTGLDDLVLKNLSKEPISEQNDSEILRAIKTMQVAIAELKKEIATLKGS